MALHKKVKYVFALLVLTLSGCGGGSGDGGGPAITGVAATGAPAVGLVSLRVGSSAINPISVYTSSDGSYSIPTGSLNGPVLLQVNTALNKNLYSISPGNSGVANINPLSTIVTAVAAAPADLTKAFAASKSDINLLPIIAKMTAADNAVQTVLAPMLAAFNVKGSLINSKYIANHADADAMLDLIDVSINYVAGTVTITDKNKSPPSNVIYTATLTDILAKLPPVMDHKLIPNPVVHSVGFDLYVANCAVCHGDINNTSLIGRSTVNKIAAAINGNIGAMRNLGSLSSDDIASINDAINSTAPAVVLPPTAASNGATLYATNCASCHNPLATSTKKDISVVRLQNSIATNAGGMSYLSTLSANDMEAIVLALSTGASPPVADPTVDGLVLYDTNCSACHGPLATSNKKGATISGYNAAVSGNVGNMGYLSTLTVAEANAIIGVLTPATTSPPPTATTPLTGSQLYAAHCASCHGPLATSTKAKTTSTAINNAIANNTGGMGYLSATLTSSNVSLIVQALSTSTAPAPAPTPVGGAALYAANCASCHGTLTSSTKIGTTVTKTNTAISGNVGGMGYLSTLTSTNVTDIVAALQIAQPPPPATPPTGAELYATNCANCHGPLATSAKAGTTVGKTQTAIGANVGGMGYLSTLSAQNLTDIVAALATVTLPPPPVGTPPGDTLYTANCASCHGPLDVSTKARSTMTGPIISSAINGNVGNMGYLSTLTTQNLADIASSLVLAPPYSAPPAPSVPPTGDQLYATNCSSCHGPLASSTKAGTTAAKTNAAISANTGGMGYLSTLTAANVNSIVASLATVVPPPVSSTATGADLYATYCAGCHNPLSTSTKGGATTAQTVAAINSAVPSIASAMGTVTLKALKTTDIDKISSALAAIKPPACGSCHAIVTPTTLKTGHHGISDHSGRSCSTCHGSGFKSTSSGNTTTGTGTDASIHNNGIKNIVSTIGWIPPKLSSTGVVQTKGSCSPSCHGKQSW